LKFIVENNRESSHFIRSTAISSLVQGHFMFYLLIYLLGESVLIGILD